MPPGVLWGVDMSDAINDHGLAGAVGTVHGGISGWHVTDTIALLVVPARSWVPVQPVKYLAFTYKLSIDDIGSTFWELTGEEKDRAPEARNASVVADQYIGYLAQRTLTTPTRIPLSDLRAFTAWTRKIAGNGSLWTEVSSHESLSIPEHIPIYWASPHIFTQGPTEFSKLLPIHQEWWKAIRATYNTQFVPSAYQDADEAM